MSVASTTDRGAALVFEPLATPGQWRVAGGSEPHTIIAGAGGLACTCKGYQYRQRCYHVRELQRRQTEDRVSASQPIAAPPADPPSPLALVQPSHGNGHATEPTPRRFTLRSDTELAAMPPLTWVLADLLPDGGLGVLYGPPGCGKSFLALAWAMAIARGAPWLGHETRRGPVVYVAAEGGHGLAQRVRAYRDAHAIPDKVDAFFVIEPLSLLELKDVGDLLRAIDAGLTADWADAYFIDPAESRVNPQLVVFDTMARVMPGGDENSAQDVGRVIAAADRIRREADCHVLLIHHTQKTGELERGSSALRGAADAMFALKNEDGCLTLECTKQKDAKAAQAHRLRLAPVGASCVIEPDEGTDLPGELKDTERAALEALYAVSQADGATATEWLAGTATGRNNSQMGNGSFYRARKRLLDLGFITRELKAKRYSLSPKGLGYVLPTPK